MNVYSPYKAAHHTKRIEDLRAGKLIYPTQVQIDLTNECNHHCLFCFYRYPENSNKLYSIDTDRMLELLDEFVELGIPAIHFTGGGEPFKHKDIYSILEKTVENDIEFALVTNGTLIDLDKIDLINECTWIRLSLDAATAHTYSITQGISEEDFHKVMKLIDMLVGYGTSIVGLSFVANPINYTEIIDFVKMAKRLKVDNVRFSVACTPKGVNLYQNIWSNIEALIKEAKEFQDGHFKVFDLITDRLENLDIQKKEITSCGYQHFTTVIGADSNVYPCCMLKYNPAAILGNIYEGTFKEICMGEKRTAWLDSDYLKVICDKNPCWMGVKNQFLNYLTEQKPLHANFI